MIPFLKNIAERLVSKGLDNRQNIAVVLPNKRATVFFKHYLSQIINKPIILPEFLSVEEFMQKLSGLQILDNISLQFKLYDSYLNSPPVEIDSFDDFLNWSNILINDFNEIDKNMIDAKSIFSNLKDVKELDSWALDDWSLSVKELTKVQTDFIEFYEHLYAWYKHFTDSLEKDNYAYQGMIFRKAALKKEEFNYTWDKIWFVGLNAITNSEKIVINFLKQKNIARVFWDADKYYYDNKLHEAGSFLRSQKDMWSEIDFKGVEDNFAKRKSEFNIIACPKYVSQAHVTGQILQRINIEELENNETAVILADENLLYPVLSHLPNKINKLNVTMGSPLKNTSLFSFIEALFTMQVRSIEMNSSAFYYKEFLLLINHPVMLQLTDVNNIHSLKTDVYIYNKVFISKTFISKYIDNDELINIFFNIWDTSSMALDTIEKLVSLLRVKLSKNENNIETEILFTINKCFLLLRNLFINNSYKLEIKTLLSVLKQSISKEVIHFSGEPLKGLQLMGILESRTLDFKNLIILNVNEGCLPKGKTINSFIPYELKKYFKMPTYKDNEAIMSYHFYRLLQRAEKINLLYNTETDDFGAGEKSRFITQLISEYKLGKIEEYTYYDGSYEFIQDKIVIPNYNMLKDIKSWAQKGVSPSALSKYIKCSLAFYYHYLSKIRKNENLDEFADNSHLGIVVHEALDNNYNKGLLTENKIDKWENGILEDIRKEFINFFSEDNINEGKNYLSLKIAEKLTLDFLKLEKREISVFSKQNLNIDIIELEQFIYTKLKVDNIEFKLSGKVDRIDKIQNKLRIVDYKTGRVGSSELNFENYEDLILKPNKSKAFQLLMYAYLYLRMNSKYLNLEVVAGNFSFKNLNEGFIHISQKIDNKNQELKINSEVMDKIEEQISEVMKKIMTNDFIQTDDVSACEYCDYRLICKR